MKRLASLAICTTALLAACAQPQDGNPVAPSTSSGRTAVQQAAVFGPAAPRAPGTESGIAAVFAPPSPIFPVNEGEATHSEPAFGTLNALRQGPLVGPAFYQFQISEDADFTRLIAVVTVPEGDGHTSFILKQQLQPGAQYAWRVFAYDDSNGSDWSPVQRFTAVFVAPPPPPAPSPGPSVPTPTPTGPASCVAGDPLSIVICQRNLYRGFMSDSTMARFMRGIARDLNLNRIMGGGFGVLRKTSGHNCEGISCDIICRGEGSRQEQYDVLSDIDGAQRPVWTGPLGTIRADACFVQ